jgi:ubiquinone/menaquinone biosynthesis C-methylase UbiE
MYSLVELSIADISRLYSYILHEAYGAGYSIKGFGYAWIDTSHAWQRGEKVLDVGAGYSSLPIHIQESYGCEVWAVDDFGLDSDDPFWARDLNPDEHISTHPQVKYVLERLGDAASSALPENYFDVIYSVSTLEHVPYTLMPAVWKHMDRLLKPGGEMLHTVDIMFPSNGGVKKVVAAHLFDILHPLLPRQLKLKHCLATPNNYARLCLKQLGMRLKAGNGLGTLRFVLDPQVLTESLEYGMNRIVKDKMSGYRNQRTGSLLIHLKKY